MKVLLVEPKKLKGWGKNQQYIGLLRLGHYHQAVCTISKLSHLPRSLMI